MLTTDQLNQVKSVASNGGVTPGQPLDDDAAYNSWKQSAQQQAQGSASAAPGAVSSAPRNVFQQAAGAFLDPIATTGERFGEAVGTAGLEGANALSGGAVDQFYRTHFGHTLDEGLNAASSQPSRLPVLGTNMQPSEQDTPEQVGGRALSTIALGANGIAAGGAAFGAGAAMQQKEGAGGVAGTAIATALGGKVLEYGFNAVAPYIAKAIEQYGAPVAEKLASYVPESSRTAFAHIAEQVGAKIPNVGDAQILPGAVGDAINKTNEAVSNAAEVPFTAVEGALSKAGNAGKQSATDLLAGVKNKISGANVGDALPTAVDRLAEVQPETAIGAKSTNPLDMYNEFHAQEEKFKTDNKEDTALGLVGSRIGKNFNKVASMRRAAGKTMSDEMSRIGQTPTNISEHFPALEDELQRNGLTFDADSGKLASSRTSKVTEDDKSLLEDYVNKLNELGPSPTAAELDAFLSRTPQELDVYKNKNNITKVTNGERIIKGSLHDIGKELTAAKNPEFNGYETAKKDYGSLSGFLDEGSKYLGKKTQSGDYTHDASLAKSSVQSLLNNGKKDWLLKLEALTGYRGLDEATLATQAMKDAGNFRGNSLLELLSPQSGGKIPLSKSGLVEKAVQGGIDAGRKAFVGSPADQTRRIIQERLQAAAEGGGTSFNVGAVPQTAHANFPRAMGLSPEDQAVQEAAITKYLADPKGMLDQYLKENGNVVNTDNARKLFSDVGYEGHNSAAVHTPSKAISDAAFQHHLENATPGQDAYFMAGGSGAGKSSITRLMQDRMSKAAVVFDGNLSSKSSALDKIGRAYSKGLNVTVPYVYRDASEAWDGVIGRMLGNGPDKGRVVPLANFLENTGGSLKVVKDLHKEGTPVLGYHNNVGVKDVKALSGDELHALSHPEGLEKTLVRATEQKALEGVMTPKQYESLLHGIPHTPFNDLK